MKKVLVILFILFSLSGNCLAEEILTDFNGYLWGIDFETIDKKVGLLSYKIDDGLEWHFNFKDMMRNSKDEVLVASSYVFFEKKLIAGIFSF